MSCNPPEQFLTKKEAAARLGCGLTRLRSAIQEGQIVEVPFGKRMMVRMSSILTIMGQASTKQDEAAHSDTQR